MSQLGHLRTSKSYSNSPQPALFHWLNNSAAAPQHCVAHKRLSADTGMRLQKLLPFYQCCGSKYIEFGSGSRILAQFGSGSDSRVMLSVWEAKFKNNFREKQFSLKVYFY